MIILSAQDLEDYGVRQTASIITFMGKAFVRGQTYAKRLRDMAIATAEESMRRGSACLLVDFDTHITLWREEKNIAALTSQIQVAKPSIRPPSSSAPTAEYDLRMPQEEFNDPGTPPPDTSLSAEGQALSRLLFGHDEMCGDQPVNLPPQFSPSNTDDTYGTFEA
ncbi:MAG: hypothetical protein AAGD25_25785 [Cyanobacteria bacterium P01_F01_bin.150]